jgi:hypothetical protein
VGTSATSIFVSSSPANLRRNTQFSTTVLNIFFNSSADDTLGFPFV